MNAIAEEAWMEVDLRSISPSELDRIELKLVEAIRSGVEEENNFRASSGTKITAETKLVGNRPAGQTPEKDRLVRTELEASKIVGFTPVLSYGSTDSNLPMSLGVPAITLRGGGRSDNTHSLDEWFEPANAWKGPQIVFLTVLNYDHSSSKADAAQR